MSHKTKKAFTIIELIFVIVIIGILSAVAVPKLTGTANAAYLSKAKSQLSAVMSAMSTERQKRILRGNASTNISDLGDSTYAFDKFDSGSTEVVSVPVKNCATSTSKGCWKRSDKAPRTFTYKFSDSTNTAIFNITNNRLVCNGTVVANLKQCERLLY